MSRIIAPQEFRVVAEGGAGRGSNATAHSMAFFRGALYLGSGCGNVSAGEEAPRILRYAKVRGAWESVYEPPLIEANARSHVPDRNVASHKKLLARAEQRRRGRGRVPRDTGYGAMCVFRGKSDAKPALYVGSISRAGGLMLRSADGASFTEVSEPGFGNPDIYSFRSLAALNGRLFAAPSGTVTDAYLDRDLAPETMVYVSEDPAAGLWQEAAETAFGDPRNLGVCSLATAHGHVYAGLANPERGFQLWRTAALGKPPYRWEPIVIDGADAFNHNFLAASMVEFNGALYVGTGITGFGHDPVHDIGPASAELIRVHPDGSWDLIFGRVRFTRDGLKVPLSLLGPGLDDYYNSVVCALGVHDGTIYLGTHQWEPFRSLELGAKEIVGGYQLWASANGEDWELVIEDGHGNAAELDIRALVSTPLGLFVGSNNHSKQLKTIGRLRGRSDLVFPDGFRVLLGR